MSATYTAQRGVNRKSMMVAEATLILIGLMVGASLAFYLCIRTMPLPNQTTIYVTKP